jgi:hypothetical protein
VYAISVPFERAHRGRGGAFGCAGFVARYTMFLLAVVLTGSAAACADTYVNSSAWFGPELILRPGSPIAFVKRRRLDAKGSIRHTLWGERSSVVLDVSDLRYSRLDLRTCAETPVRRFRVLASEFSWGTAPDDLWVLAPPSLREVEPIAGGPRIDVSVELGARPDWPEPNPEVPREADVGMGWRPTGLHVWDLERRAVADVAIPAGIRVQSIVMPQRCRKRAVTPMSWGIPSTSRTRGASWLST